jgi:hypothetical protein
MEIVLGGAGAWFAGTAMRHKHSGGEARCDNSPKSAAAILTSKTLVCGAHSIGRGAHAAATAMAFFGEHERAIDVYGHELSNLVTRREGTFT